MNRWRWLTGAFLLVAAVVVSAAFVGGAGGAGKSSRDDGEHACTLASLKGAYAFHFAGSAGAPAGPDTDVASAGLAVSDGTGHLSGHDWASLGGATTPRTFTGTYTVEPDCTGMAHLVVTPTGPANLFFVLGSGGRVLKAIQTDAGTVVSGDAVRQ